MPAKRKIAAIVLLVLLTALYIFSLPGRTPDIDDAWIGEHAYWLAHTGKVKSELMRGITQQEDYLIVHHKLLTLHGALFIKVFGFSLYSLKSLSLSYFILFLVIFFLYTVRIKKIFSFFDWIVAMILLITFPWIFKYSFLYRPEMMLMTFGFLSFILIERHPFFPRAGIWFPILSGMASGLAVVTHLNGLVVAGAGFVYLLFNKDWRSLVYYSLGTMVILPVYFYDFNTNYGWSYWVYQMTESPALDSVPDAPLVLQPFLNLFEEHRRYFHNPKIIVFTIFIYTTISVKLKYLWRNHRSVVLYTALYMVLLGLIGIHKSRQYILMFFPLLLMLTTISLKALAVDVAVKSSKLFSVKIITVIIIGALFIGVSSYYNIRLSTEKFHAAENRTLSEKYFNPPYDTCNIIAPMTFIFDEIEHYNRIQGEVCYTELQKTDPSIFGEGFLLKAAVFDIDHILLTPYYSDLLGTASWKVDEVHAGYLVLSNRQGSMILTRATALDE
jgi:hypothetical protein